MSDTKITIQNDNQNIKKGNIPEQASVDSSIHMPVVKNEKEDVCRSVSHKEEEHKTRRTKLNADAVIFGKKKTYVISYELNPLGMIPDNEPFDYNDYDEEYGDRNAFVRKVLTILLVMLIVTGAFIFLVSLVKGLNHFFRSYWLILFIPSVLAMFIISCVMPQATCARKAPTNYVCLVLAVIFESIFCGTITAKYQPHLLFYTFLATSLVVLVCVLLAFTRFDFTKWYLIVVVVSTCLAFLMAIVTLSTLVFHIETRPVIIGVLVLITLANVVLLVIQLQMVLGGKSVELSEHDYALGAFLLYVSIINIFIDILRIAGFAE